MGQQNYPGTAPLLCNSGNSCLNSPVLVIACFRGIDNTDGLNLIFAEVRYCVDNDPWD